MSHKNLPPRDADAILERLQADYENMPIQLQKAARYLIDHPHEVGIQSMRTIANAANVQPNSLMRLAKYLGFDGFEAMRERFRDFLRSGMGAFPNRASWLQSLAYEGGMDAIFGQMASGCISNMEQLFQSQDFADIDRAASQILEADRVFIVGVGAAYALAYHFWYVARMAFDHLIAVPRQGSTPLDDVARIGKDDVLLAVTFQPYRSETMQAAHYVRQLHNNQRNRKKNAAKIIAITDSRTAPLARIADITLITPTHTPHFFQSQASATALLETLLALMIAKGGNDIAQRVDSFHRERWNAGFYEEEPQT